MTTTTGVKVVRRVLVMQRYNAGTPGAFTERVVLFHRLKYIIEQLINVYAHFPDHDDGAVPAGDGTRHQGVKVTYNVRVLDAPVGDMHQSLHDLVETDILVVVVSDNNPNVIFELAVRRALRAGLIMIVFDEESVPVYCRTDKYVDWKAEASAEVNDRLTRLNVNGLYFKSPTPAAIQDVVKGDGRLIERMREALQSWEDEFKQPRHLSGLLKYVSPGDVIANWETFSPIEIVRITWKGMSGRGFYNPGDVLRGPVVQASNPLFLDMFSLSELPNPIGPDPLTAVASLRRLGEIGYVDKPDLERFTEEQADLADRIIFRRQAGTPARVPLRFNERAPEPFRKKAFLPVIVAKNVIGPRDSTHDTYFAVIFTPIEDPDGFGR